jgi:hypothetical protein
MMWVTVKKKPPNLPNPLREIRQFAQQLEGHLALVLTEMAGTS